VLVVFAAPLGLLAPSPLLGPEALVCTPTLRECGDTGERGGRPLTKRVSDDAPDRIRTCDLRFRRHALEVALATVKRPYVI